MTDVNAVPHFAGLTGRKLRMAITATATVGFLLFGYDQGVMSGIITGEHFNADFPATDGNDAYHSTIQGTVTSVYEVGCFGGAIGALIFGERLGRRKAIIMGAIIMILGTIIQVTSFKGKWELGQFIIGRIVTGVGNGANTASIPVWQAETSRSHNRGLLICIEAAMIAVGTVIAYWLDFGFSYVDNSSQWRFPIAFQVVFAFLLIGGVMLLPESPRWLLNHDHNEQAGVVLAALNGAPVNDPATLKEKKIIMDSIRKLTSMEAQSGFKDVFSRGKGQHLRRMLIGSSSQMFQQLGGCNAVIYYCPVLFEESINMSRTMSLILGGVNATVYAISTLLSFVFVERAGRRKLFLIGSVGQCLAMVLIFACLIPGTEDAAIGAAVGLFVFIIFFGATWLELPWLYPAELSPLKTRTRANAISTSTNWIFNFLIVQVTPTMIASIGWGTYLFFAVMNALFIPIIYLFYPETAGRSLEEIDIVFAKAFVDSKSPVYVAKTMPKLSQEEIERYGVELGAAGDRPSAMEDEEEKPGARADKEGEDETGGVPKGG
ncbi:sugar porter family MFS transporter [Ascodesmis nigricans]|uniref:Sugar porter family MFS transporter n=1 Tax=Ascodesmis nigricans TaxID=341454 RepID=A0A4S2MTM9_9PEZI|nr:sugar porter family MFS transporter [Ascodesmis nigricans]